MTMTYLHINAALVGEGIGSSQCNKSLSQHYSELREMSQAEHNAAFAEARGGQASKTEITKLKKELARRDAELNVSKTKNTELIHTNANLERDNQRLREILGFD